MLKASQAMELGLTGSGGFAIPSVGPTAAMYGGMRLQLSYVSHLGGTSKPPYRVLILGLALASLTRAQAPRPSDPGTMKRSSIQPIAEAPSHRARLPLSARKRSVFWG